MHAGSTDHCAGAVREILECDVDLAEAAKRLHRSHPEESEDESDVGLNASLSWEDIEESDDDDILEEPFLDADYDDERNWFLVTLVKFDSRQLGRIQTTTVAVFVNINDRGCAIQTLQGPAEKG